MIKFESEKCFEDFLYKEFQEDGICLVNDEEYQDCIKQFNTGSYGIPDLVYYSSDYEIINEEEQIKHMRIHVVELKNEPIKLSHIAQIARYKTFFSRAYSGFDVEMEFSLVVPEGVKSSDDCCFMTNALDGISIYEYKLNPRTGISFDQSSGWHRVNVDNQIALDLFGLEEKDREDF